LRFFDTNPTVLIKVLEFILAVFTQMEAMNEGLNDLEMQSFLPYLLLKVFFLNFYFLKLKKILVW